MRDNLIDKKQRKQYISRDKNSSTNNFYQSCIIKTRIEKIGNYYNWRKDNAQQTPNTKV